MQKLSLLTTRNFSRKEYIHNLCGMWTNQFIKSYTMSSLSLLYCYNTLMVMIVIIYKLDLIIFVVVIVHHYFHHRWSETIFLVDTRNPMYKLYLHSLIGKVGRDKHCRRLCRMSSNSSSWQFFCFVYDCCCWENNYLFNFIILIHWFAFFNNNNNNDYNNLQFDYGKQTYSNEGLFFSKCH